MYNVSVNAHVMYKCVCGCGCVCVCMSSCLYVCDMYLYTECVRTLLCGNFVSCRMNYKDLVVCLNTIPFGDV